MTNNTISDAAILEIFEKEQTSVETRTKGKSVPNSEIVEAITMFFDVTRKDSMPVTVMAGSVQKYLTAKYNAIPENEEMVEASIGRDVFEMTNLELKELRLSQLTYILSSTKPDGTPQRDSIYRRVYNLARDNKRFGYDKSSGSITRDPVPGASPKKKGKKQA